MQTNVLTVLVADDQREVIALISSWLREMGHVPLAALSGREAYSLLQSMRVDALVTDLVMLDGNGIELILNARERFPSLRIVAISGGQQIDAAAAAGANLCLRKPLFREQLIAALRAEGAAP